MKNTRELLVRIVFYVLLSSMIICTVMACCLLADSSTVAYWLFGSAAFSVVLQLFVALIATLCGSKVKINGFKQWATSIIVYVVVVVVVAVFPLLLVLFVLDAICQGCRRHSDSGK